MAAQKQRTDTVTYLFLMGIKPKRPICLRENIILEPATCCPDPEAMIDSVMNQKTGTCSEIDLGILISTLRQTQAQLLIKAKDIKQIAIHAWNAQIDITLLAALTGKEIYWHIQCDTEAEKFSKDSLISVVVNTRLYLPREVYTIEEDECLWLEENFHTANELMKEKRFYTAVNSLWSYRMNLNPFMQMAVLWAGIESLIGVGNSELAHRISTLSALFLEDDAKKARKIKKLYNARSKAVHEGKVKNPDDITESATLLHDLILKCVESHNLPNEEKLLFN